MIPPKQLDKLKRELKSKKIILFQNSSVVEKMFLSIFKQSDVKQDQILRLTDEKELKDALKSKKYSFLISEINDDNVCSTRLLNRISGIEESVRPTLLFVVEVHLYKNLIKEGQDIIDEIVQKPLPYKKAADSLLKAINVNKVNGPYLRAIKEGNTLFSLGKKEEAISALKKTVKMHPRPSFSYYSIARTYKTMGQLKKAIDVILKSLTYNKLHYKSLRLLFDLFDEVSEEKKAYNTLKSIFNLYPPSEEELSRAIWLSVKINEFYDIKKLINLYLKLDDKSEKLDMHLGAGIYVLAKYMFLEEKGSQDIVETLSSLKFLKKNYMVYIRHLLEFLYEKDSTFLLEEVFEAFEGCPDKGKDYDISQIIYKARVEKNETELIESSVKLIDNGIVNKTVFLILLTNLSNAQEYDKFDRYFNMAKALWPSENFNSMKRAEV